MNKKIITILVGIFIIVSIFFINNCFKEQQDNEKSKNSYLTATVLSIAKNYVTMQDENNIIYKIFISDVIDLKVGEKLEIEYKGKLDTTNNIRDSQIIGYKVLETMNNNVPDLWNDNGIFSDFYDASYSKLKNMTIDEKIGQILLVRVPETNKIEDLKKYHFGGYLLFKRDFDGKTKNEVIQMINNFQNNSDIPLLIAADEEGGTVSRISSNNNLVETPFKSPRELYQLGGFDLIKEDTIKKSKILAELGINLNLAPVVDVTTSENDYMYNRSIGLSTYLTSQFAKTVIEASKEGSVSYTLKHFPGYGNNADTHLGASIDTRSLESIKENDLPPFKAGIDSLAEAVLISHNLVQAIDKDMPASLSIPVHNLLRDDLNFTGIIITDDLAMNAVNQQTSAIDAIKAGNDLLIVTDYEGAINQIKNALQTNSLSEEQINKMAFRVLAWKFYKGLIIPNQK